MARLIVTAEGSRSFGDFRMVVSVSAEADGQPTTGLKAKNFIVTHLVSLDPPPGPEGWLEALSLGKVDKVKEGPPGFYIVNLKHPGALSTLPPGHYAIGVAVTTYSGRVGAATHHGQTLAGYTAVSE